VLHYLADQRIITTEQHENAIRALIKAHIGDMPFNEQRLLELAEDEDWASGSVAAALGRPAAWTDTPRAAALFGRLIGLAQSHRPATVPGWLYNALQGAAANVGAPAAATDIAARLLAITIHQSKTQGNPAAALVAAARLALAHTDDPKPPPSPGPLPACAVLLRDTYAKAIPHVLATRYVIATFAALPDPDREAVMQVLLR